MINLVFDLFHFRRALSLDKKYNSNDWNSRLFPSDWLWALPHTSSRRIYNRLLHENNLRSMLYKMALKKSIMPILSTKRII